MKLVDLLDLVRVPNAPTAVADVLAAALLGHTVVDGPAEPLRVAAAAGASLCLYLAGMALNDVADADLDARERPTRPIPSGRVGRGAAAGLTGVLAAVGLLLAWGAGSEAFGMAVVLTVLIAVYDLGLAGRPLAGPVGMALCRAWNWCLGLAAVGALGSFATFGAVASFVFVFGLTHLSLGEVGGSARSALAVVSLTTLAVILGAVLAADHLFGAWSGTRTVRLALPLLAFAVFVGPPLARAWLRPVGPRIGAAVGALVGGITLLDAAWGGATHSWLALSAFAPLFAAQIVLRRRFRVS